MAHLIQSYSAQKDKTPNNRNITDWEDFFVWKGITCPTDVNQLSPRSFTPSEFKKMFDQQTKEMQTELEIYANYKIYNTPTKNETIEQYANLFFYQNKVYLKNALLTDSTRYAERTNTFIEQPITHEPLDDYLTEDIIEEKKRFDDINFVFNKSKHNPFVVGISTQSIRDITGYSYTPVPEWSTSGHPVFIKWQKWMLEDRSNILVIDGSRQMGKSFGMSELLIEESFIPGKDILVCAFLQKTTNAMLTYMRKFMADFSEDDFTVFKKDGYIINNTTGVSIHFRTLNDWGANVLGLTLRLIVIDEAQLIPTEVYEDVLKPTMTTTGGRIVMIGTAIQDISSYMFETIMEIAKGQKYNWPGQKTARHIKVSADENPLIHPLERREINDNRDKPSIQRQYFNKWGKWADSSFNPQAVSIFDMPKLNQSGHIILGLDPARKNDRSGYLYAHAYDNKVTVVSSWDVPALSKVDWWNQVKFHNNHIPKYTDGFKSFSTVMDVTGVGDAVAYIYTNGWLRINNTIRYTTGQSESEPLPGSYNVSKHVLINNALDMIDAGQVTVISETNPDLLEEIRFLLIKESKFWTLSFESKFFDDITNAFMLVLYIARKCRYIYRVDVSKVNDTNSFTHEIRSSYKKPYRPKQVSSGNF
mgnify:FL=1